MLSIDAVSLRIQRATILNDISLEVRSGETVGIIGPNGSGKTTLFNCISGFAVPQQGRVLFQGRDITRLPPHQRARDGLGRIFQNSGVFREMTVLENLFTALEGRRSFFSTFLPWSRTTTTLKQEALSYLEMVGLRSKALARAGSLSGGQMRLLEIVRTLAYGAELFLLDEPTAGVSPKMKEEVVALVKRLQEMKKAIVVIEHDMNFIQKFCQRIVVLDSGRVALDGTPEQVRADPMLQAIYFGQSAM